MSHATHQIFVAGIHTGVGKTIASAILTEALQADYWKPVQAGVEPETDTQTVKRLVTNTQSRFFEEAYLLKTACSPHRASEIDKNPIKLSKIQMPNTTNNLIIEGAGGLLSPLNRKKTIVSLIAALQVPVILVSRHYLGSINHTLMSAMILKIYNIKVIGIVWSGNEDYATESIILKHTGYAVVGRIKEHATFDSQLIAYYAVKFASFFAR
ncbi:MAG: dethiobiotin synthase [Chitinophagia bacterium]|nr:dethiobiotin synthase [Chitinophagia bacterium]